MQHTVRMEAFDTLGKLYSNALGEMYVCFSFLWFKLTTQCSDKSNPTAISQFGWIPSVLIEAPIQSVEVAVPAEDALERYIFPLPSPSKTGITKLSALGRAEEEIDEEDWTKKFLKTFANLDERCLDSVLVMAGLNSKYVFC